MTLLNWAQLIALAFAALFFALKLAQGWLMVNVSLEGAVQRATRGHGRDDLAISVTVTKGGNGSVRIHDASVRVETSPDSEVVRSKLTGIRRLETTQGQPYEVDTSWATKKAHGLYRMPPGESTTWSCCVDVPSGASCLVDIVVLGVQWPGRFPAQWRCSLVSLPGET